MKRECQGCAWFVWGAAAYVHGKNAGSCFNRPPVAVMIDGEPHGIRPHVEATDRACSQWERIEP